ncbi:MAG: hypothetical protein KKH32_01330 [Bacteroidetes bacterium]|nr:hypothetical protein [Bacteroidota bacterium]
MGNYIQIILSVVIGSLIILMLMRLTFDIGEESNETNVEQMVQSNLLTLAFTIENDFRRIGYKSPVDPILNADSSSLTFLSDIKLSGKVDTIKYVLGSLGSAAHTPNPNDRVLYRIVGAESSKVASSGLTKFKLRYFDVNGSETMTPIFIKSINIELRLESDAKVKDYYPFFEKSVLIKPRNLN